MKRKISFKERIVAWLKRDVTNNELFALLLLCLLGKSLLVPMTMYLVPIQTGIVGVELSEEQTHEMAVTLYEKLVGSFISPIHRLNEFGLSLHGKVVGEIIGAAIGAIPWLIFTSLLVVAICIIRMIIKTIFFRNKNEKTK